MEDLQIKSQVIHIVLEFAISAMITFFIGVKLKVVEIGSIHDLVGNIFIIALLCGITILSIYNSSQNDAKDINKKLLEK